MGETLVVEVKIGVDGRSGVPSCELVLRAGFTARRWGGGGMCVADVGT